MLTDLKSNPEIRASARDTLKGNWGKAILASVIFAVISYIIGSVGTSFKEIGWIFDLLYLLIAGSWVAGIMAYFLKLVRREPVSINLIFSQLQHMFAYFKLYLLMILYIILWTLLLIIPGILASLRYSQSFYIMIDNPEMKPSEVINRSKEMMQGQKMKLFLLLLSFIGWYLLSIITLGIGFIWLIPYIHTTQATFYEELRVKYEEQHAKSNEMTIR